MKVKKEMCVSHQLRILFDSTANISKTNNFTDRKIESMEKSYRFKFQENIKGRNEVFQKKNITANIIST